MENLSACGLSCAVSRFLALLAGGRHLKRKLLILLWLLRPAHKRLGDIFLSNSFDCGSLPQSIARRSLPKSVHYHYLFRLQREALLIAYPVMYPAWLPFQWDANTFSYCAAVIHQIAGVTIQIVQNLANDIYPPMSLCIIAGHVHLLSGRVAKVGADAKKSKEQHSHALIECIEDHRKLVRIFQLTQDTLSQPQLAQFISSGLNMCIVLFYLIFYVKNVFAYIYYAVYFVSMAIELLPSCFYGSKLIYEFQQLPSAVFKCSWLGQSREFHQNQRIFVQLSLKEIVPLAGGVIGIQLNSFLGTCKMAYSLYTVCNRMK